MKRLFKVTLLALLFLVGGNSFAQNYKFGHIDSAKLLSIMPEKAEAAKQIQAKLQEFNKQLQEMQADRQKLLNAYVAERDKLSEVVRANKEKEIQDLQNRMQTFDGWAQQEVQNKQNELFEPIYKKAMKAIKDVADENNFTYIFDVSSGVILFHSADSKDVTALVKAKLGIQ